MLFLTLGAEFLFVSQIIVYAGAIVILFLFVIMLLGVDRNEDLAEPRRFQTRQLAIGAASSRSSSSVRWPVRSRRARSRSAPRGSSRVRLGRVHRRRPVPELLASFRADGPDAARGHDRHPDAGEAQAEMT